MRLAGVALRQAYLSYKGLFLWLNWPSYISNVILRPVLTVTMFGLMGRFARGEDAAVDYVIGMTVFGMTNIVMGGLLQGFFYERSFGTLNLLFASSGSRLQNYLVRSLFHVPNALLNAAAGLLWAALVIDMDLSGASWGGVVVGLIIIAFSSAAFGIFLGNFCIIVRNWFFFMSGQQALFLSLTGMIIARDDLPGVFHALSEGLPVSHALDGLRKAFDGLPWTEVRGDFALELLVLLSYAAAGYVLFWSVEAYARRSGAYEMA